VLLARVAARTDNPYGRRAEDQELIRRHVAEVEPLLRAAASRELDGRRPVGELADDVESLLSSEAQAVSACSQWLVGRDE
jgi:hypothetical protein